MPKTVTPADRRKNLVLDAANAASCTQALVDLLAKPNGIESADPAEVARLVKAAEAATCRIRRNFARVRDEAGAIPAAASSQRLVVVGPNLPGSLQQQGTFHVHAEGCADLKRGAIRPHAEREQAVEFRTCVEVAEHIYDNGIMAEDESGEDYLFDFHFAPCVTIPVR